IYSDVFAALRQSGDTFEVTLELTFTKDGATTTLPYTMSFRETAALTIEADNGAFWSAGGYSNGGSLLYLPVGEPVEVMAYLSSNYYNFLGWEVDGVLSADATYTFELTQDTTVRLRAEPMESSLDFNLETVNFGAGYEGDAVQPR